MVNAIQYLQYCMHNTNNSYETLPKIDAGGGPETGLPLGVALSSAVTATQVAETLLIYKTFISHTLNITPHL